MSIQVTVWNENRWKESTKDMYRVYPEGIHGRLREIFEAAGYSVKVALLDDPEQGLSREVLENTDVLVYWSHIAQQEVPDETAERIAERVNRGMGFIPLHSAHMSKPFVRLMGTTCTLRWRESDDEELMWTACAGHPITRGVPPCVRFAPEEMYGEYFDIPSPDETVFISWFTGGEVFRSGVCYRRGRGRIFYFQPGHETYPTYYIPEIERILVNAVAWAAQGEAEDEARVRRHTAAALETMPVCRDMRMPEK